MLISSTILVNRAEMADNGPNILTQSCRSLFMKCLSVCFSLNSFYDSVKELTICLAPVLGVSLSTIKSPFFFLLYLGIRNIHNFIKNTYSPIFFTHGIWSISDIHKYYFISLQKFLPLEKA